MSPVSRRRTPKSASRGRRAPVTPRSSRRAPALDLLTRELAKLGTVTDAFVAEGVGTFLFDVLDERGPAPDDAFAAFCREVVDDPRATRSPLAVQAVALVAALGPHEVRDHAAAVRASVDAEVAATLPGWVEQLGAVHLVEGGALRTTDSRESVLHLLLDYDEPAAGSRHLLTVAIEHGEERVHLLDVRGREPGDSLAPMADKYAESVEPVWSWLDAAEVGPLVESAVRTTARRTQQDWPVQDIAGAATVCWTLGVRRLEQLTGLDLTTREDA